MTITPEQRADLRALLAAARGCEFDLTPADGPIAKLTLFVHEHGDALLDALDTPPVPANAEGRERVLEEAAKVADREKELAQDNLNEGYQLAHNRGCHEASRRIAFAIRAMRAFTAQPMPHKQIATDRASVGNDPAQPSTPDVPTEAMRP